MAIFEVFLDAQNCLPKTMTYFYPPRMAVLSSFFQLFIVHGMYNFGQGFRKNGLILKTGKLCGYILPTST